VKLDFGRGVQERRQRHLKTAAGHDGKIDVMSIYINLSTVKFIPLRPVSFRRSAPSRPPGPHRP
jgi:hypothetical protein